MVFVTLDGTVISRRRTDLCSPKPHGNVLLYERKLQERVLKINEIERHKVTHAVSASLQHACLWGVQRRGDGAIYRRKIGPLSATMASRLYRPQGGHFYRLALIVGKPSGLRSLDVRGPRR
jgi:hypothetical protein